MLGQPRFCCLKRCFSRDVTYHDVAVMVSWVGFGGGVLPLVLAESLMLATSFRARQFWNKSLPYNYPLYVGNSEAHASEFFPD